MVIGHGAWGMGHGALGQKRCILLCNNESLILVHPPLILINESLILVHPPFILVNDIMSAKLPIIKEPHPAKAVLCLPSPLFGRGWGWGSSGLITNQADII